MAHLPILLIALGLYFLGLATGCHASGREVRETVQEIYWNLRPRAWKEEMTTEGYPEGRKRRAGA